MNDGKMISAIRDKDEAAINAVIDKYSKLLWSVVRAVLHKIGTTEDIEECVADAFIYLWENPQKFDPQRGTLKAWLVIVARTKAIDRCREIGKRDSVPLEETLLADEVGFAEGVIREETTRVLVTAVNALGEPDREILVRRYYYDQKPKEIALALGMSVKQVDNRLYQAKQKLRTAIGGI